MKQAQKNLSERRTGNDRRRWICSHSFPYVDSHGFLVEGERRQCTERRNLRDKNKFKS